jgi:hypothetical protein
MLIEKNRHSSLSTIMQEDQGNRSQSKRQRGVTNG